MQMLLFLKLIFAHIMGDFFLQTNKISEGKRSQFMIYRLPFLGLHSLINAIMAYSIVGKWDRWEIPLVIFVSHFIIDFVKSFFDEKNIRIFITDQLAHLIVIGGIYIYLTWDDFKISTDWLSDYHIWGVAICYLLAMKPASILLGIFTAKWNSQTDAKKNLPNAGTWIGYIERILILTFMLVDCMQGIGFLLAAKSVFRFGDLKAPKNVKTTEYVLIGTLSSFAIATLLGVLALYI